MFRALIKHQIWVKYKGKLLARYRSQGFYKPPEQISLGKDSSGNHAANHLKTKSLWTCCHNCNKNHLLNLTDEKEKQQESVSVLKSLEKAASGQSWVTGKFPATCNYVQEQGSAGRLWPLTSGTPQIPFAGEISQPDSSALISNLRLVTKQLRAAHLKSGCWALASLTQWPQQGPILVAINFLP